MDILPTCLDLARVEYPDRFNGHNITPLDGKGLTSVLEGGEREGHDRIFFEHVGGKAVLENDWKLVTLRQGLPVGYTTSRTTRGNRLIGRTIILVAQRG